MFIRGSFTDEDAHYIKDDLDDFLIYFASAEKGDHADGILYEKGESHIYDAIDLWNVLDSNKGRKLKKLWQEDITSDKNYNGEKIPEYSYLMSLEQLDVVIDLLEGLDDELLTIADKQGYLKPEAVGAVKQRSPLLIEEESLDGKHIYALSSPLFHAKTILRFLKLAQKLRRQVEVS